MPRKKTKGKTLTVAGLANKVADHLQLLTRLVWADDNGYVSCCCCGVTKHYKEGIQGGHYVPRSKSPTKLERNNINPQCAGCNKQMHHGCTLTWENYRIFMIETYGEDELQRLLQKAKEKWKWDREELNEELKRVRQEIKEQEERVLAHPG